MLTISTPVCVSLRSPPEDNIVQYAAACRAQSSRLKSISCSEMPRDDSGLTTPQDESLNKLCDDVAARLETRIKQKYLCLNEQKYFVYPPKLAHANFNHFFFCLFQTNHLSRQITSYSQRTELCKISQALLSLSFSVFLLQYLLQQSAQQHWHAFPSLLSKEWL